MKRRPHTTFLYYMQGHEDLTSARRQRELERTCADSVGVAARGRGRDRPAAIAAAMMGPGQTLALPRSALYTRSMARLEPAGQGRQARQQEDLIVFHACWQFVWAHFPLLARRAPRPEK